MPADKQSTALAYGEHNLEALHHNSMTWLRGAHLAPPLGLGDERRVREIYTRNADEFGPNETRELPLPTPGGVQKVRVFSLHGARLLAMLASTPEAKRFRRWVIDRLTELDAARPDTAARAKRHARIEEQVARFRQHLLAEDERYDPFVERLDRIDQDIAALNVDKRDVYAEARVAGLSEEELRSMRTSRRMVAIGWEAPRRRALRHD
jgi:prophage antirepressor-like protein